MNMFEFIEGAVVQLKSGGPKMTCTGRKHYMVAAYDKEMVECQWFVGSKLESEWFSPESLVIVD
jgi:uncharacterized protein YodC (DUF2158 family)